MYTFTIKEFFEQNKANEVTLLAVANKGWYECSIGCILTATIIRGF